MHTNRAGGSPLTDGGFFAEPQLEYAAYGGGNVPRPAAGQEGRHQGFYPLNSHFLLGGSGADCRHVTAAKRGTAVGLLLRLFRKIFAVHRQRTATHTVYSTQARHTRVAQFVSLEVTDSTYESIYLVTFILAGPVYNNALKNRAALLCRAQRK